jgi:3-mercaptopyruvate sulfurtransferase SseA
MPKRKPKPQSFPILILIAGGFLLLSSVIWLFMQSQPTSTAVAPNTSAGQTSPDVQRVSITEARTALEAGTAVFVDVRIAEAYAAQRIAGAVNIPEAEARSRLTELNPNQWIITYCT